MVKVLKQFQVCSQPPATLMLQELERQAEQLQADTAAGQAAFERAGGEAEAAEARVQQLAADIETELATKVSSSRTAALTPTVLAQALKSGGSRGATHAVEEPTPCGSSHGCGLT